jgi:hypothetical protein
MGNEIAEVSGAKTFDAHGRGFDGAATSRQETPPRVE